MSQLMNSTTLSQNRSKCHAFYATIEWQRGQYVLQCFVRSQGQHVLLEDIIRLSGHSLCPNEVTMYRWDIYFLTSKIGHVTGCSPLRWSCGRSLECHMTLSGSWFRRANTSGGPVVILCYLNFTLPTSPYMISGRVRDCQDEVI